MLKICVIGGGPSGLMSAGIAAQDGNLVYLYEKNKTVGKKLLITGKGRCNVTNLCDTNTLIANTVCNGKFLYSAFSSFSSKDTIEFFEKYGTPLKIERGNRVFPASDQSNDVLLALKRFINEQKVKIRYCAVKEIVCENNIITGIIEEDGSFKEFDKVILCTGGLSYPLTGSTGDGYNFAKALGHTITPLKGSLVPLEIKENWVSDLQGLSLKNVTSTLISNGKKVFSDFGEMLFTHFGVSGPIILSLSSHIEDIMCENKIIIDLKPALSIETLENRILKDFSKYINKEIKNALNELLPIKIIPIILKISEINPTTKVNNITKEERMRLVQNIKSFTLNIKAFRPIEEAIITSGGVKTSQINPKTMESKLVKGLFFAGEIIDVNAYTGGFNLQIAFSTGFVAGKSVKI